MAATAAGGSTLHGVSDNEKRWVVFGIVLNKVLIRKIRLFVEQHVQIEYGNLKTSHGIDTQSATGRLQHWPNLGPARQIWLKYENINGNDSLPKVHGKYNYSVFDCRVTSHVDFAKLYVENFMAKFNAFDEHCDVSAVLNLLSKVPVFSAAVQSAASDVRQARNAWAHCAFSDWDPVNFQQCFTEMEQLVKALGLPAKDERDLLTDLKDWETKGTILCVNATVDPDLLKLVHCHVNTLTKDVEMLAFEVKEDRDKVLKALTDISTKLEELEKRLGSVEREQEIMKQEQSSVSNKVETLHANLETTQENLKSLELKQEDVQQRVAHVEDQLSRGASDVKAEHLQAGRGMEKQGSAIPQISCEIANCEADITFFADRYDPDTRQWLFKDFDKWFSDPGDSRAYVLLGDAGIGKSVMAGALAQRTRKAGHLSAAYFCRHYDGTRNDPRYLLGTIACQLCDCNSQYSNIVGGEGGVRMMLTDSKLGVHELFTKLLEEPLSNCDLCQQRKLVIVDALDETEYESREEFLDLIKERFPRLPKWLVFFITSRPEDTVQSRLERYNPCVRICAGNSKQRSCYQQHEQDIQRFLEKKVDFSRLHYSVEEVTMKCNGLFLYAFYIAEVLKDSVHSGKIDQLSQLSEFFPGDIEDYFRANFQRVFKKVGADLYKKLFGCIITAPAPLPVSFISFILNKENSNLEEQDVIDAVSLFVVLRMSDQTMTFIHNLIPAWLTNKKKAGKLIIDKKTAGEYFRKIFIQILVDVVSKPMQTVQCVDADLQSFVLQVAVRFLCQNGDKDSRKVVFSYLTSYRLLEKRIQSGRIEIYRLLEDLKLAAGCFTVKEAQKKNILQEISLALETDVHVLSECPHLLRSCVQNASNFVQESILIPQVSVPWMEWNIWDISAVEILSKCNCFATASDKKTVAVAKGRSFFFVDASTLQTVSGPFEVSQDTIKEINHLEFSPDDKFVFFGRLDKWFSVEQGYVKDFPQFTGNSVVCQWGLFTSCGQYIVVKKNDFLHFPQTCQDKCCIAELLALWAVKEIDHSRDDERTCSFGQLSKAITGISTMGDQTKGLLKFLHVNPKMHQTRAKFVPDPTCYYCYRFKELIRKPTRKKGGRSLATVRQLIIELYPWIFQYQIWNLQTGRPMLHDVFFLGVQLNSFAYFCHVTRAFDKWGVSMGLFGVDKALSVCNIAMVNAIHALFGLEEEYPGQSRNLEREMTKLSSFTVKDERLKLQSKKEKLQKKMLELQQKQEQKQKGIHTQRLELELELEQKHKLIQKQRQDMEMEMKNELYRRQEHQLEQLRKKEQELVQELEKGSELVQTWRLEMDLKQVQKRRLELELELELEQAAKLRSVLEMQQTYEQVQERKLELGLVRSRSPEKELEQVRKEEQELEQELEHWWKMELEQQEQEQVEKLKSELQQTLEQMIDKQNPVQKLEVVQKQKLELQLDQVREREQGLDLRKELDLEQLRKWEQNLELQLQQMLKLKQLEEEELDQKVDLKLRCVQEQQLELWLEQVGKKELELKRKQMLMLHLDLFCNSFKSSICLYLPNGFLDLVGRDISLCVSPKKDWIVKGMDFGEIHLLQTGIQEQDCCYYNNEKREHNITGLKHFTFTNDDLFVVYLSAADSLHALSLQTGTVFTSVSGRNLFFFTLEKQTGYLFASETEERAIFLSDLFSPFKFFPVLPVMKSEFGSSVATIFRSSNTVMSVSSSSIVTLWNITGEKRGIAFNFISNSSLTSCRSQVLHVKNCALSPDGKVIAFQQETKIELCSFAESGEFHSTVFEADFGFTDVCLTFSADGTFLFCIQNNIKDPHFYVWDVQNKVLPAIVTLLGRRIMNVECCCLSSDKRELILCGEYEIEIWNWYDKFSFRLLTQIVVEMSYKSVKFSHCAISLDNELLVCCIANLIFLYNLHVADVRSSKRVLRGHLGKIEFCKFLKVNRYLISYAVDGMVFLWDIIESNAAGFARIAQGQEKIVSMAVSPEEDRVICFLSSDRVCVINLCNLECALSSKFLTAPAKGKVDTTAETSRLQPAGQIASTSEVPCSSVEDESFSSSDSDEDMSYYYQEQEEFDEFD